MIPVSLKQVATILNGTLLNVSDANVIIDSISTDSRKIVENSLFFALVGERFDGHDFAEQIMQQGATAIVVERQLTENIPQILVADTKKALGLLAHWVRMKSDVKVIALTGSSGKTSVKEMCAAILKQSGQTLFTQGNLNNDIGVPLTLLRLTPEDRFAVIELGANHIGEIAYTTSLAQPISVLVNNIAAAHLEGFGSLEGVAKAKGEIFSGLPAQDGTAVINLDSYSPEWLKLLSHQSVVSFSLHSNKAQYYASDIVETDCSTFTLHTPTEQFEVSLPLIGLHNVSNAIAATVLTMSVGATKQDIQQGLATVQPVKGRLYPIQIRKNQLIYDDTYNANVGSMLAAINVLERQPGFRVFVAGDMGELGKDAIECHEQVGIAAKKANIDCVLTVGKLSQNISMQSVSGKHFETKSALIEELQKLFLKHKKITVLIKGSRSAQMEQIIESFL